MKHLTDAEMQQMKADNWDVEDVELGPISERYLQPSLQFDPEEYSRVISQASEASRLVDIYNNSGKVLLHLLLPWHVTAKAVVPSIRDERECHEKDLFPWFMMHNGCYCVWLVAGFLRAAALGGDLGENYRVPFRGRCGIYPGSPAQGDRCTTCCHSSVCIVT